MSDILAWMLSVPRGPMYLLLGVGAAVENIVPAVPADTFVALGGLLSALGTLDAWTVFFVTWGANVTSALAMYRVGYTHGRPFFEERWGRHVLSAHQMERMSTFYDRWGLFAIFFTRFLPGLRAIVPVFAGVTYQGFVPVAIPLTVASAIWYGALVWIGTVAGRNLDVLANVLGRLNNTLGIAAVILATAVAIWWWRTRHPPHD
ncbi:MAG: DedA family protein [Gemmatimonadota bacterium]